MHKEALVKLAAVKSTPISVRLNNQRASDQSLHRAMLMKIISSIKFLARQGIALRGHNDDSQGNLRQLLLLRAEDDPCLKEWLSKNDYTSPVIINEIINLMGQQVLRELLGEVRAAKWFTIIADEATDVSQNELISISIRWVDTDYMIHEDSLCLVQLENTKATTLFSRFFDSMLFTNQLV